MFLLPRLQQNYDAKDGHYLTLNSTRKDSHAGVYSGSQGIKKNNTESVFIKKKISKKYKFSATNNESEN